jgi:hypothetical protein
MVRTLPIRQPTRWRMSCNDLGHGQKCHAVEGLASARAAGLRTGGSKTRPYKVCEVRRGLQVNLH